MLMDAIPPKHDPVSPWWNTNQLLIIIDWIWWKFLLGKGSRDRSHCQQKTASEAIEQWWIHQKKKNQKQKGRKNIIKGKCINASTFFGDRHLSLAANHYSFTIYSRVNQVSIHQPHRYFVTWNSCSSCPKLEWALNNQLLSYRSQ